MATLKYCKLGTIFSKENIFGLNVMSAEDGVNSKLMYYMSLQVPVIFAL